MSLILCTKCGKSISDQSTKCVFCGQSAQGLIADYGNLGDKNRDERNISNAKTYYSIALLLCKNMIVNNDSFEEYRHLSYLYSALSSIEINSENFVKAHEYISEFISFCQIYEKRIGVRETKEYLSDSYCELGNIAKTQKNYASARAYYQKALDLSREIVEEISDKQTLKCLMEKYIEVGDVEIEDKKYSTAKKFFLEAEKIFNVLMNAEYSVDLDIVQGAIYDRLGNVEIEIGNKQEANAFYQKSLISAIRLSEKIGSLQSGFNLALVHWHISRTVFGDEQLSHVKSAYDLWHFINQQSPGYPGVEELLYRAERAKKALQNTNVNTSNSNGTVNSQYGGLQEKVIVYAKMFRSIFSNITKIDANPLETIEQGWFREEYLLSVNTDVEIRFSAYCEVHFFDHNYSLPDGRIIPAVNAKMGLRAFVSNPFETNTTIFEIKKTSEGADFRFKADGKNTLIVIVDNYESVITQFCRVVLENGDRYLEIMKQMN